MVDQTILDYLRGASGENRRGVAYPWCESRQTLVGGFRELMAARCRRFKILYRGLHDVVSFNLMISNPSDDDLLKFYLE